MTRKELLDSLALHNDVATKAAGERILDHILETITETVVNGEEVALGQSFGKFVPATQAARAGVAMGVEYSKPATKTIKFKASDPLKRKLAGN